MCYRLPHSAHPVEIELSVPTADATFQLDLFGRLRRATEAARPQLLATQNAQQTVVPDAGG